MKRILLLLVTCFFSLATFASPVNNLIFFGDSLSDNGNLYHLLLKYIPKPPYYEGRFSNGITWAEQVGNYYKNKNGSDYSIYAVGGATAEYHAPSTKFVTISTLAEQYYQYSLYAWHQSKSDVLYTIWIGGNDYLFDETDDLNTLTSDVVNNIGWLMTTLIGQGAQYFLVINMPDLSLSPFARDNHMIDRLRDASQLHNQKLAALVKDMQAANPRLNIVYVDSYTFMNDVVQNIDKYNQKYNINIKNTTDSCWTGGFRLKDAALLPDSRLQNSELAQVYAISEAYQQGATACGNPDEYLFWDIMHPTAVTHRVLSEVILEKLNPMMG